MPRVVTVAVVLDTTRTQWAAARMPRLDRGGRIGKVLWSRTDIPIRATLSGKGRPTTLEPTAMRQDPFVMGVATTATINQLLHLELLATVSKSTRRWSGLTARLTRFPVVASHRPGLCLRL